MYYETFRHMKKQLGHLVLLSHLLTVISDRDLPLG